MDGRVAASIAQIRDAFLVVRPEERRAPLPFESTLLEGNTAAALAGVTVPKYRLSA
jgi:hypothetical protein